MHKTWTTQRVFTFDNGDGTATITSGDADKLEVNYPSAPGGYKGMDVDACHICGRVYHVDQLEYYEGKAYCIPRGCYKDIESLQQRRQSRHVGVLEGRR